jgi:hypothetical protein
VPCDRNMYAFSGIEVGDEIEAMGSSGPARNVRLRRRLRQRLRWQKLRPHCPGGGGKTTGGRPGSDDTTPAGPCGPCLIYCLFPICKEASLPSIGGPPLSLRTAMLARNLHSLTFGTLHMQPLLQGCSDFSDRKCNTAQNSPVAAMPEVPR